MAAEINELFEQAASECENLTKETDSLLDAVNQASDRADVLADRVEMEGQKASHSLTELGDRLGEAEDGLESKAKDARDHMEALQKKMAARKCEGHSHPHPTDSNNPNCS